MLRCNARLTSNCAHLHNQKIAFYINLFGKASHKTCWSIWFSYFSKTCYLLALLFQQAFETFNNFFGKWENYYRRIIKMPIVMHQFKFWQSFDCQIGVMNTIVNTQQKWCNFLLYLGNNFSDLQNINPTSKPIHEFPRNIFKLQTPIIKQVQH